MAINDTKLPEAYLPRYAGYIFKNRFRQTVDDYKYFACKTINPSAEPFLFRRGGEVPFETACYRGRGGLTEEPLEALLKRSGTTAFLVIRDDTVIFERYPNGGGQMPSRFMSVTKSVTSALIGMAVDSGLIGSLDAPVTDFLPELRRGGFDKLTLRNLLNMDSGIPYDEGLAPWSLQMGLYYTNDARRDMLRLKIKDPVGETFHYNDWHPELLALILERTTGMPVERFLEERLWKPIGAQSPALLVTDGERSGFPKMDSGLAGTAEDLAKFGRLYLNNGRLGGEQLLSEEWVRESTSPRGADGDPARFSRYDRHPWGNWFRSGNAYYTHMWWGYRTGAEQNDYFAMGVLGQILYVCPRKNMILVRLGTDWGFPGWWPTVLKGLADRC